MFVLVDYYSRYFEVAVSKTSSENITALMSKLFLIHGLPFSIHSDNGSSVFKSTF